MTYNPKNKVGLVVVGKVIGLNLGSTLPLKQNRYKSKLGLSDKGRAKKWLVV